MSWFKIDDGFWSHPKILLLSPQAIALWVRAGTWCSQQLTDGKVEPHVMPMFLATPDATRELVDARLWHITGDKCDDCEAVATMPKTGYLFHDWLKYQRSRDEVLAEREAARIRQKRARDKAKEKRDVTESPAETSAGSDAGSHAVRHGVTDDVSNGPPDPTRPDLLTPIGVSTKSPTAKAVGAKGARLPEPFMLNAEMRAWAAEEVPGVLIEAATREFADYWRGVPGTRGVKADWVATWRNWLRKKAGDAPGTAAVPVSKTKRAQSLIDLGRARDQANEMGAITA